MADCSVTNVVVGQMRSASYISRAAAGLKVNA